MIGNEQVLYDRIVIPQEWESEVTERKIETDKTLLISVAGTLARIFSNFNIFSTSDTLTVSYSVFKFPLIVFSFRRLSSNLYLPATRGKSHVLLVASFFLLFKKHILNFDPLLMILNHAGAAKSQKTKIRSGEKFSGPDEHGTRDKVHLRLPTLLGRSFYSLTT